MQPATTTQGNPHQLTTELVVHFVSSVRQVFTTMMSATVNVGTPHRKNDPSSSYDVSAIIGFSGLVTGSMVISFDKEAAGNVVAAFAGAPAAPGSIEFSDAIGELANMIAGGAKKNFGTSANISVPSVVIGAGHTVSRLHDVPCIVIPCATTYGRFAIEVSIKATKLD